MAEEHGLKMTLIDTAPEGFAVIQFAGVMDEETSGEARSKIDAMTQGKTFNHLIFDLSDLSYINSKGIGFLVSMQAHLSKENKKLAIVNPSETVSDVMALVGINQIIGVYDSLEKAYQE